MLINLRNALMSGRTSKPVTWVDGEYYALDGTVTSNSAFARMVDYIPVAGGNSVTWKWGNSSNGYCFLIVYNSEKTRIDFWSPNNSAGERTITINRNAAFVRYSVGINFKDSTFFRDNTTGKYIVKDGRIMPA